MYRQYLYLTAVLWFFTLGAGASVATSSSSTTPTPALLDMFETVLQRVITVRQLAPKQAITRAIRSRQQMRALLREVLDDTLSPEEWVIEHKALHAWGLLDADFPLKAFVLDLLAEQAAGYYDPQRQTFFIADWLPPDLQQPILAHELVHALQDQHYDIRGNFAPVKQHADRTLAHKALLEGDALAVMLAYMLQPLGASLEQLPDLESVMPSGTAFLGEQFQLYERAPMVLQQQLLFPYLSGLTFIKAALMHAGWNGLQQVYQRPPVSTEQILHPEKYFAATPEHPHDVSLHLPERLLQGDWRKLKRDVLGEFLLSVVLRQFLPENEARQSAAGWHGDRYELFEHAASGRLLLVGVTVWDSDSDALEFFQSYTKLVQVKYADWQQLPATRAMEYIWQHGQFRVVLSQQGQEVQLLEGVPALYLPDLRTLLQERVRTVAPDKD